MILTVTLNPAWDITHVVTLLEPGATHRPASVAEQPGGKGVNVSRVLHQLGHPTRATGLAAGAPGRRLRDGLAAAGIPESFVLCDGNAAETGRTLTIVESESGRATILNEPGPAFGPHDWHALVRRVDQLAADADAVVLAGSLPGGIPMDAYRILTELVHEHGAPVVVDADGAALRAALPARPDLVKPNLAELRSATGRHDPVAGARRLRELGAARVVVSAGPAGLTGFDESGAWCALPAPLLPVNPTGAGDAAVAALAVGLAERRTWPDQLRTAAAWSAAAVLEPRAGSVAADRIGALARTTTVNPLIIEAAAPERSGDRSTSPC